MNKRRPLVEGLHHRRIDADVETRFVAGEGKTPKKPASQSPPPDQSAAPPDSALVPISTRLRPDIAHALRRASLERKLNRESQNTVQEIIESALDPWLRDHGYLS